MDITTQYTKDGYWVVVPPLVTPSWYVRLFDEAIKQARQKRSSAHYMLAQLLSQYNAHYCFSNDGVRIRFDHEQDYTIMLLKWS